MNFKAKIFLIIAIISLSNFGSKAVPKNSSDQYESSDEESYKKDQDLDRARKDARAEKLKNFLNLKQERKLTNDSRDIWNVPADLYSSSEEEQQRIRKKQDDLALASMRIAADEYTNRNLKIEKKSKKYSQNIWNAKKKIHSSDEEESKNDSHVTWNAKLKKEEEQRIIEKKDEDQKFFLWQDDCKKIESSDDDDRANKNNSSNDWGVIE